MADTPATSPASEMVPVRFTADRLVIEPVVERLWGRLAFVTRRGIDVFVAIDVTNVGQEAGTFAAALVLDGEVTGWRDVRFQAGERKQVRFRLYNLPRGTHWVSLAGFTGTFTSSRSVDWYRIAATGFTALVLAGAAAGWLTCRRR